MRSSTGFLHRTRWRAVFDFDNWLWALFVTAMGVICMAMLACAVSLARDTTGHDWYATGKLTLTELLIGMGARESAPAEYRTSRGEVLILTHRELAFNGNALVARGHVLRTAREAAELGTWCGLGGALLCLALFRRPDRRGFRHRVREPASEQATPVQPEPAAPAPEPPEGTPDSRVQRSTGPSPERKRRSTRATGKSGGRAKTRRTRRRRHYGSWA